jgi:hypothetical protein
MQLDLIVLTKTKEMIRYCESFGHGGKMLSTHVTNDLARVSVTTKDVLQQLVTFTHAPKGPALV